MEDRLSDGFFYGLYMDPDRLADLGVKPANPRVAKVVGYRIDLHGSAKIVPDSGKSVWGMIFSLSDEDLRTLYSGPKTGDYRSVLMKAQTSDGSETLVKCYNLESDPVAELNREYLAHLIAVARKVGLPGGYIRELESMGQ